jgi:hypothetical protein
LVKSEADKEKYLRRLASRNQQMQHQAQYQLRAYQAAAAATAAVKNVEARQQLIYTQSRSFGSGGIDISSLPSNIVPTNTFFPFLTSHEL